MSEQDFQRFMTGFQYAPLKIHWVRSLAYVGS